MQICKSGTFKYVWGPIEVAHKRGLDSLIELCIVQVQYIALLKSPSKAVWLLAKTVVGVKFRRRRDGETG